MAGLFSVNPQPLCVSLCPKRSKRLIPADTNYTWHFKSASCLLGDKDWGWRTSKLTYEWIQLAEKRPVLCNQGKDRCSINDLYRVTPNTLGALPSVTSPFPFLGVLSLPYELSTLLTIYPGLIICCGTQEPRHFNRHLRDVLAGTWDLDLHLLLWSLDI